MLEPQRSGEEKHFEQLKHLNYGEPNNKLDILWFSLILELILFKVFDCLNFDCWKMVYPFESDCIISNSFSNKEK